MEVEQIPAFLATMIYEDMIRFPDREQRIACIARYLRLAAQVSIELLLEREKQAESEAAE